ncbi:MAG: flippase-like domain-containing protein [candidate division WOR-3 bacterium]
MKIVEREKVKKGIRLLFLIFFISFIFVFFHSFSKLDIQYFKNIKIFFLFLLILSSLFYIIFAGLSISFASFSFNKKVNPSFSIEILLSGYFLASITPFGSGGLPYQLFLLSRKKLSLGEGTFILYIFAFFKYLFLFSSLVLNLKFLTINKNAYIRMIFSYIILLIILMFIIPLFLFIFPEEKLKFFPLKFEGNFKKILSFLFNELFNFKRVFIVFLKNPNYFLLSLLFAFKSFLSLVLIIPLIFFALGVKIEFFKIFLVSSFIYVLLLFSPSPGGIGYAEIISFFLISKNLESSLIPLIVFLWRFFSFYIFAFSGAFFILWRISKWKL